jgi:hypothetical protein
VDYVIDSGEKLYAVEVKSGRAKRLSGLAAFCRRHENAIPVMIDRSRGERLLRGEPLAAVAGGQA